MCPVDTKGISCGERLFGQIFKSFLLPLGQAQTCHLLPIGKVMMEGIFILVSSLLYSQEIVMNPMVCFSKIVVLIARVQFKRGNHSINFGFYEVVRTCTTVPMTLISLLPLCSFLKQQSSFLGGSKELIRVMKWFDHFSELEASEMAPFHVGGIERLARLTESVGEKPKESQDEEAGSIIIVL